MLILTRKIGEKVLIVLEDGSIIEVIVLNKKQMSQVKLGFNADQKIKILRENLYEKIKAKGEDIK